MAASVKYPVDERHREWADTAHQKEVLEMRLSGMSVESIGQHMGVPGTNITRTLKTIFQKAGTTATTLLTTLIRRYPATSFWPGSPIDTSLLTGSGNYPNNTCWAGGGRTKTLTSM
jgi:hypothetical protein